MLCNVALLSLLAPSSAVFLMRSPSFGAAYDLVANPFAHHYYQPSALWPSVFQFHNDFPLFTRPSLFDQLRRERQSLLSSTLQLANALEERLPVAHEKIWREAEEHVETTLRVRGLSAEQLTAEVADGVLTVRGERACDGCRKVSCSVPLPFEVTDAASQVELNLAEDGQLTVRVPKTARVPQPTPTPLRITTAEPAAKETTKEAALPSPSPSAVEADTLKALEEKFPAAPAPTEAPSPVPPPAAKPAHGIEGEGTTVDAAATEPPSATQKLRRAVGTAIDASRLAAAPSDAAAAKSNASGEAAPAPVEASAEPKAAPAAA